MMDETPRQLHTVRLTSVELTLLAAALQEYAAAWQEHLPHYAERARQLAVQLRLQQRTDLQLGVGAVLADPQQLLQDLEKEMTP